MIQISVNPFCSETTDLQATRQFIDPTFRPTKDNGKLRLLDIHQAGHGIKLFALFDTDIVLIDQIGGQFFGCDLNVFGLFHKLNTDTLDRFWHRC